LHPGRTLDKAQIAGIVHLVASSVPEMPPSAVSVLDDTGKLLSAPRPMAVAPSADAEQLQYVQQVEQLYSRRILDILEPLVGTTMCKAQVTAELDFSQTESTTESHKPNQTPDASSGAQPAAGGKRQRRHSYQPHRGVPGCHQQPARRPAMLHPSTGSARPLAAGGQAAPAGSSRQTGVHHQLRGGQDRAGGRAVLPAWSSGSTLPWWSTTHA